MSYKKFIFICFAGLILSGCASALYMPVKDDEKKSGVSLAELKKGRELYANKCGNCHNIFLPEKYFRAEWTQNLERMQKKSGIDDNQKDIILKYLSLKAK